MKNLIIIVCAVLLMSSTCNTKYIKVQVPYMPPFSCPAVVKPQKKDLDPETMSNAELEQARRYNALAAERYVESLRNHILCYELAIANIRKQIKDAIETLDK